MATKKITKNSALKLVPETPKTKAADRESIIQEFLNAITSDITPEDPPTEASTGSFHDACLVNNHFAYNASQVNVDLAMAAGCEAGGDFGEMDFTYLDFYGSSEYGKLRQTFLENVKANLKSKDGKVDALVMAVYRAYYAGLLSPDRKEPDSAAVRQERIRRRNAEQQERVKRMAAK
jgi:hypothetical protein